LRTVSKCVGHEESAAVAAKLFLKELLSVEELSNKGLTRGHISISFDPSAANYFKTTFFDRLLDSLEDFGILLLEPPVLGS